MSSSNTQMHDMKTTVSSLVASMAVFASVFGGGSVSFADAAADANKEVGLCVIGGCKKELASCILNPKCLANLICLQTCTTSANETKCQIKCGDLFENETVGKFNACAVTQKKCVKQKPDDGSYPVPPPESLVKSFDTKMFEGQYYISAGLNPIFDTFDCQVHFFTNPAPGQVYGKLNWRIKEPDGEFFNKDTVQKFKQDKNNPAILYNHDNDYLHYEDDWYILDASDKHILVYYRGQNDAWKGYGGAVLYTRTKTVPPEIIPRVEAACERANIKWSDFQLTDNSCKPQETDAATLRALYSKKLLLMEGDALAQELTAVRGNAIETIQETEKGAVGALQKLESLRENYQSELSFDILELEDTVGQEVGEIVTGAKKEVKEIEAGVEEIEKEVGDTIWSIQKGKILKGLEKLVN